LIAANFGRALCVGRPAFLIALLLKAASGLEDMLEAGRSMRDRAKTILYAARANPCLERRLIFILPRLHAREAQLR
jgi:hypothetical protein